MTDYTDLAAVKSSIGKTVSDAQDATIARLITAVSDYIDHYCNRPDGFAAQSTATARVFAGSGTPILSIDECIEVTLVEAKAFVTDMAYTAWAADDWIAFSGDPRVPNFNKPPYTGIMTLPSGDYGIFPGGGVASRVGFPPTLDDTVIRWGVPTVQVTAKWGYAAQVPPAIEQACIIQCTRLYKRGESSFADATASGDFATLLYRQGIDPEVRGILERGRFVRPRA